MYTLRSSHVIGIVVASVIVLSVLARVTYSHRAPREVVFECKRQVSNASKSLLLARQDRSDVYTLVHCSHARTYLDCAMRAMHTNELSRHSGVDVLKLSRAIDAAYDSALSRVNSNPARARLSGRPDRTKATETFEGAHAELTLSG